MNLQTILGFILVSIIATTSLAQDESETPFAVEENCVSDAVQPSDEWSGTLLMSGYAGIHAVQADWDTPRIVAFFYTDEVGSPLNGGQLSPDGRWYGVPVGRIELEPSLNLFWFNEGLRVYNLTDNTVYQFKFEDYEDELGVQFFNCCVSSHETVQWITNDELVIGELLINPVAEEVSLAPFFAGKNFYYQRVFSPDTERVLDTLDGGVYDPYNADTLISTTEMIDGLTWRHDSNAFIADQWRNGTERNEADYLALYDRDGNFIELVFDQNAGGINLDRPFSDRSELAWSFDDRYFAFSYKETYSSPAQLYLLDFENGIAINTCLSPVSQPVWSPDSLEVAMLLDSSDSLRVLIFDVENWTLHDVARHSREINIIGTENVLEPDMIGWRSGS